MTTLVLKNLTSCGLRLLQQAPRTFNGRQFSISVRVLALDRLHTKKWEWITVKGTVGTVGISEHAQEKLGEMVFVELPEVGSTVEKGVQSCTLESTKGANEICSPASGTVTEVNKVVVDNPKMINKSPYFKGWLYKMTLSDPSELEEWRVKDEE